MIFVYKYFILSLSFFLTLLFFECRVSHSETLRKDEIQTTIEKDTTIVYNNINNLSSEGSEVTVHYSKNEANQINAIFYGGSGKAELNFTLNKNKVNINEDIYHYTKPIDNVEFNDDIILEETNTYILTKKGNFWKGDKTKIELLKLLEKEIPFTLKFQ